MSTLPGDPAGLVADIDVDELTTTLVPGAVPKATAAPLAKFVPLIVTTVPPPVGPADGETPDTVGGGAKANMSAELVALMTPLPETVTSTVPLPEGLVAVILVALVTETDGEGVVPK